MRSRDETSVVEKNRSSQGAVDLFYPCSALLTRDATVLDVGPGEILYGTHLIGRPHGGYGLGSGMIRPRAFGLRAITARPREGSAC